MPALLKVTQSRLFTETSRLKAIFDIPLTIVLVKRFPSLLHFLSHISNALHGRKSLGVTEICAFLSLVGGLSYTSNKELLIIQ